MTPSDLVVPPRSQPSTLPLAGHLGFMAYLRLLLGEAIDDAQVLRIAKRYRLDRLSPTEQQQVASEACYHRLSTSFPCLNAFSSWKVPFSSKGQQYPSTNISLPSLWPRRVLVAEARASPAGSSVLLCLGLRW